MIRDNRNSEDEMLGLGAFAGAILGLACAYFLTGCSAAGYEIGGKVGVYALDSRESNETTSAKSRPLACAWDKSYCEVENEK